MIMSMLETTDIDDHLVNFPHPVIRRHANIGLNVRVRENATRRKHVYTPLVSPEFRQNAAILRHWENHRKGIQNLSWSLTTFPKNKSWGMGLPGEHPDVMLASDLLDQVKDAEAQIVEEMIREFQKSPLFSWSAQYKGMGTGKLLARFLGEIGDPYLVQWNASGEPLAEPFPRKFSSLKRFCGMSVENGNSPSPKRGVQASYRPLARTRLWLITDQFVKQHAEPFYQMFLDGREKYSDESYRAMDAKGKPWTDERLEIVAKKRSRVLAGVTFLEMLYNESRRLHGEN